MDYSALAFVILVFVIVYIAALKFYPHLARVWLALAGGVIGVFAVLWIGFTAIRIFTTGWGGFGLLLWFAPVSIFIGGPLGFALFGISRARGRDSSRS